MPDVVDAEYVLPLRWTSDDELEDLTAYLRALHSWIDISVADGSGPELFAAHAARWRGLVRHLHVEPVPGVNGKVVGVLHGLEQARHERVVIADDDVRYSRPALVAVVHDLLSADLVKPQNYFDPLPWHARWDTARTLLNRAVSSDYPGTYAVHRSTLLAAGGYRADVLFENLELERTVRAAGGIVRTRLDLFVARRPPTLRHFLSQRVRQAYDSTAQPPRLLVEAAILPTAVALRRHPVALAALLIVLVLVAERGRRRQGGRSVFPPSSALWAPLWVAERSVTTWIALVLRARGGVRYGPGRIRAAATSLRSLRRQASLRRVGVQAGV
jgi:hypothetical protein